MSRILRVIHVFPPIPMRNFDWMVYDDDEAENPRVVGWGKTEAEAIHDFATGLAELESDNDTGNQPERPEVISTDQNESKEPQQSSSDYPGVHEVRLPARDAKLQLGVKEVSKVSGR
jgi:hypothetical protein